MSNYVVAKGALGAFKDNYKWENGKCRNIETGTYYPGDQKLSNCYGFYGPAPDGRDKWGDTFSFLKDTLLGGGAPYQQGQRPPDNSISSLMLPAVAIVGGVALLLILKKKK